MDHGDGAHPPRRRQRPQRDTAPQRPCHVQRGQCGVEVGAGRLEMERRRQHRPHGVVEARQHPRRRDWIEPVDDEPDDARDEENVAVPPVAVTAQPQQQEDERRHPEVHHEVVRRQQLRDVVVAGQPAVHRLRPGDVQHAVDMQHRPAVRESRRHHVAMQGAYLVVADREADDEQQLPPPTRSASGERRELHAVHPAKRAGTSRRRRAPRSARPARP